MSSTTKELQARIRIVQSAISRSLEKDTSTTEVTRTSGTTAKIDFNKELSEAALWEIALSMIHNVSVIYDHCYTWAEKTGVNTVEVKNVTANCEALRILRDLDISDKHPTNRASKSGLSPKLQTVFQFLRLTGEDAKLSFSIKDGVSISGDASLIVSGIIIDEKTGKEIGDLADLTQKGVLAWEAFLKNKGIIS